MSAEELTERINGAQALINEAQFDTVHALCDEILREVEINGSLQQSERDVLRIRALKVRGDAYGVAGHFDIARSTLIETISLAEALGDDMVMGRVLLSSGNVELYQQRYADSAEWYRRGVEYAERANDDKTLAGLYCNLGVSFMEVGDLSNAIAWYEKALPVGERSGDKPFLANIYSNLGSTLLLLDEHDQARRCFEECLHISRSIDDVAAVGHVYYHLGNLYVSLKDHEQALTSYRMSIQESERASESLMVAYALSGLGTLHHLQGEYEEALDSKRESLQRVTSLNDPLLQAHLLHDIGLVLFDACGADDDGREAEQYLRRSMQLASELDAKRVLSESHKVLERIHVNRGEWQAAYEANKQYHELDRIIRSDEARTNARMLEHRRQIEASERDRQVKLARFQEQERIFHNILPAPIADRLIDGETTIAESVDNVSIFFSDIVGFTTLASAISATELVDGLNQIFTEFDRLASHHELEKIKTIGDAYMAVCGVPDPHTDHAVRVANFALDVSTMISQFSLSPANIPIQLRIGLHCGSVVAGVIGTKKFAYDLWGDSVNIAARMESHGEAGRIHVSQQFAQSLQLQAPSSFALIERGERTIKGKGTMVTYWLEHR